MEVLYLYFCNGYYYLMMVEGGIGRGYLVIVCWVKNIIGFYEFDFGFFMLIVSDKFVFIL